jgi:hypothetical protein
MIYEKNVILQIFISRYVHSELITYDEKTLHFINHKMKIKKKASKYVNAKILTCYLINVKIMIM